MGRTRLRVYACWLCNCIYSAGTALKVPSANHCARATNRRSWSAVKMPFLSDSYRRSSFAFRNGANSLISACCRAHQRIHRRQKVCPADFRSGIKGIYNMPDRFSCACCSHLHLRQQSLNLCFSGGGQMGMDLVLPFINFPINCVKPGGAILVFASH